MATIRVEDENRTISDPQEISAFLAPFGIWYEKWDVEGRIGEDATNEDILSEYKSEIDQMKQRGGFVTADVISVNPQTPGLDAMLNKFNREHTHSEDEVRFTIKGQGVFHIHPDNGPVFGIQVEAGDLINVPHGTKHWFDLCDDRTIRCIRLFEDQTGWAPHYIEGSTLHEQYTPVCLGPNYLGPEGSVDPVVKI